MFDHKHYVPIIKWKQGEQDALATLKESLHGNFTPLIELPFIETNHIEKRLARSIEEQINRISTSIKKNLIESSAFIDFKFLDEKKQLSNGTLASELYDKSMKKGLHLIPVVSPNSSEATIIAAQENRENGICFRIPDIYLDDIPSAITKVKHNFRDVPLSSIDLVLDLGSILNSQLSILKIITNSIMNTIPNLNSWRTISLSSSTFPPDLSSIDRDSIKFIPRLEWLNWKSRYQDSKGVRLPTFGDYPISHPDVIDIDFRIMDRSASIRYSDVNNWIIIKGRSIKKKPQGIQNRENAIKLISLSEYSGPNFSWGDSFIKQCAEGGKCGSATTWRQVGVNHHITLVIDQLSNLS